jgi:hypothetical protein
MHTTRGTSFGDDDGCGVPEKPGRAQVLWNFTAKQSMRPSNPPEEHRLLSDDEGGVPENRARSSAFIKANSSAPQLPEHCPRR